MKNHVLVLIFKIPSAFYCKTRLISSIGAQNAVEFSSAMIKDIVIEFSKSVDISEYCTDRYLCYRSKSDDNNLEFLNDIFGYLKEWKILNINNLSSSNDLGEILREIISHFSSSYSESITFIGSDCLQLKVIEWLHGMRIASDYHSCYICPSEDGGYTLLSVPLNNGDIRKLSHIFNNIVWSSELTCIHQIISLRAYGFKVQVGKTYFDIDEYKDLLQLYHYYKFEMLQGLKFTSKLLLEFKKNLLL